MREKAELTWKWIIIGGGSVAGVWAQIPAVMQTLVTLMALDILTGLIAGAATKELKSSTMWVGLLKKCSLFPLLWTLHIVEQPLHLPFELEQLAAMAYIVYEVMSIIENCAKSGVPIPSVVVSALAKAKIKTATAKEIEQEFSVKTTETKPDGGQVTTLQQTKVTVTKPTEATPVEPGK